MKKNTIRNKRRNQLGRIIATICAVLACLASATAQDFGIHFLGNTSDNVTGTAGVVPIGHWNNIAAGTGSVTITGSDGSTTATLNRAGGQANNAWHSGLAGDGANQSLLDGYMDAGSYGGSPAILTISGLSNSYYNVYIYTFPDGSRPQNSGDWLPNYNVNGTTYYSPVIGNSGSSTYNTTGTTIGGSGFSGFIQGTPVLANSNAKPNATNFGNYIMLANVQASGGVITIEPQKDGTTYRSPFNGIELVPTTPPAAPVPNAPTESPSTAFLGVGVGSLVTLNGSAVGSSPISYQWQTDGGTGNTPTNIPGATSTNLVVNTAGLNPGTYVYDYTADNAFGSTNSTTVSILVVATSPTRAISVQFQGGGGSATLAPSQVAGIVPHDFWNLDNETTTLLYTNLVDSTGAAVSATVQATYFNNQYHTGDASGTADDILMSGGFWSGGGYTVNVTGIPYSSYYVYVYMLNDNNPNRRYGLTLGNQTYWGSVFNGNTYSTPPYTLDTQTAELAQGTQMQADVVEFTGVTGSSFTISGQTPDGNVAMLGMEIVNPSAGPAVANPIQISPAQGTVYTGLPVLLSEFAFGASPLSYQWQTDGGTGGALTNIPGATNSTLPINTTAFSPGNYNYEVMVTNATGSSTSAVATVTITASAPVLLTDISPTPANEAFVGQTITYSPVFGGSLPITYQWMVDTGSGPTNIPASVNSSAITSTLVLSNVQLSQSGTYSLSASNSVGGPVTTSSSALTVLADPAPPAPNSYGALVLSNHPVAYWRFNETNDPSTGVLPAYDSSGNGFHGIYGQNSQNGFNGIVGPEPTNFPGFETNNVALESEENLTNSWVTVPPLNLDTNNVNTTITAWIYPTANEPQFGGVLYNRPYAAGIGFGGSLNNSGMSELGYTWNNNDPATWGFNSGLYPLLNQWSFIALVVQTNQATLYLYYIDPNTGQPDLFSAVNPIAHIAAPFDTNNVTTIGTDLSDPDVRAFSGSIDEVAVFNKALTSSQLLSLFGQATGISEVAPTASAPAESPSTAKIALLAGSNVTLTASASGSTPISIQWQTDGGSGGALTNIPGATSTTLAVNTSGWLPGTYNYDFVAANSIGTNVSAEVPITIVTVMMVDMGPNTPTPGTNDISQLLYANQNDDGFNYYTDNGANNGEWNGQTFTTGNNPGGYVLKTLAWKSAGNGNSFGTFQLYDLYIYSLSSDGSTATQIASYQGYGGGTELDWFQWLGLSTTLSPSTQYAYAFGRDSSSAGWEHIGNQSGNPYAGGQLCQIPSAGGTVNYGNSGISDATFDIGLLAVPSSTLSIGAGSGGNLKITWSQGTLLQATNILGPWVTNSAATSPYSVAPTNSQMYFKVRVQ
jgi:Concanavalin A-like lectin/glucanases superfamily